MKVTAIKQQVRNSERASIYLNGKYSFSLSINQLVAERLKVGEDLSEARLKELVEASQNEKLRLRAMNWVLMRPRSIRELSQYLSRKDPGKTDNQWIIDDFASRGWIDDEQFARWWLDRSSRQKRSLSHLKAELAQKGVSRDIIALVVSEKDDTNALSEAITKLKSKPRYHDREKLTRYLVSKGFRYSSVSEALKLDAAGDNLD